MCTTVNGQLASYPGQVGELGMRLVVHYSVIMHYTNTVNGQLASYPGQVGELGMRLINNILLYMQRCRILLEGQFVERLVNFHEVVHVCSIVSCKSPCHAHLYKVGMDYETSNGPLRT